MHCVEIMEEIGKQCNITLFTAQQMLSAIYTKPSMKLAPSYSCHIDSDDLYMLRSALSDALKQMGGCLVQYDMAMESLISYY